MDLSPGILLVGALTGLGYGVLAVGLVLVFRSNRTINLAHAQLGALAAAVLARLVLDGGLPWALALVVVTAGAAALGALVEVGVVRRLADRPPLVLLVATLGVGQVLLVAQLLLPPVRRVAGFPTPLDRSVEVFDVLLRSEHLLVIALLPALVVAVSLLLAWTPLGLAIRATAENPDAARLCTIPVRRVGATVWALAGALAAVSTVLIAPLQGAGVSSLTQALGPALLVRALVAGLAGRLESLPRALLGGVAVGALEAALLAGGTRPGAVDVAFFLLAAALVVLAVRRERAPEGTVDVAPVRLAAPTPPPLVGRWWAERPDRAAWALAGVAAAVLPLVVPGSGTTFLATRVVLFALAGLSVVVLTGWAGQLSLGQVAFVGTGSFATAGFVAAGVPFALATVLATATSAAVAVLVGLPALRVQGLYLAILTLGFAVAVVEGVFTRSAFVDETGAAIVQRPAGLAGDRAWYWLCLAVLAVALAGVAHLRRTGIGRRIVATASNPRRAASLTISEAGARITAYAISGALAGLAGALLAGLRIRFAPVDFPVDDSLRLVALAMIGGVASVGGVVLGALYLLALPALFADSLAVTVATSGVGLLVLLLFAPGGLRSVLEALHARLLLRIAAGRGHESAPGGATSDGDDVALPAALTGAVPPVPRPTSGRAATEAPAIEARGLVVAFGGTVALDGVDLVVARGELLGLIGGNGAGKSTLLSVLSGFVPADAGTVDLDGRDVTREPAHRRAALGLGRIFQDARLFPPLTVREALQVAHEAAAPTPLVPALLALPGGRRHERTARARAAELVDLLQLGAVADRPIAALSTGTRRVVELGCLLAQQASVLLLDEPTAGVAQRDAEAFGPLLLRVREALDATIVLVEHDLPLVLALSDRLQCLALGRTIADGPPAEVRTDPAVVAAYLGEDERVIARSGATGG